MPIGSMRKALAVLAAVTAALALTAPAGSSPAAAAAPEGASLTVVYPNGNELWEIGSRQTVRWTYTGDPGAEVTLSLSSGYSEPGYGGGVTYSLGSTSPGQGGSGSFTFTVPEDLRPGCTYQVTVRVPGTTCADRSDDDFKILAPGGRPPITVLFPNGGEAWEPGSTQTISWEFTDEVAAVSDTVDIYYFRPAAGMATTHYYKVGSAPLGHNGMGSYSWQLPAEGDLQGVPGDGYRTAVVARNQRYMRDTSDSGFTIGSAPQEVEQPAGGEPPPPPQVEPEGVLIVDDPSFVTLTAVPNPYGMADVAYNLQVRANDPDLSVEVSYLLLNPNGTPDNPSQGIEVHPTGELESVWGASGQCFYRTEVGGGALPEYRANPQVFALPHYRTAVMMLARGEKLYLVFLRENDGRLTYRLFTGGPFQGLDVPGLGRVTREGDRFAVRTYGGPAQVGIWDKGQYRHDEVAAGPGGSAAEELYDIPWQGMFMFMLARQDKMGLVIGDFNDGVVGAACFTGSRRLSLDTVPGLCEVSNGGVVARPGLSGPIPMVEIVATSADPVEVSCFAFDNTCWQWEVGGRAREEFRPNPQVLPLKHATPGFFTCSYDDRMGIFFYNQNDLETGILPLSPAAVGVPAAPPAAPQGGAGITVLLNGTPLSFDQPPVIVNDRTMVPLRAIFEALGAQVGWDGATQTVTATRGDTVVVLAIGSVTAFVNGLPVTLDQPALLLGDRTMVPVRFVSEALGAVVDWESATRTVIILD